MRLALGIAALCAWAATPLAPVLHASPRPQAAAPVPEYDAWQLLLAFDQPGCAAHVADAVGPEDELPKHAAGKEGPDLSRVYRGRKASVAAWKPLPEDAARGQVPELGAIDFVRLLPEGIQGNDASAFLYRRIRSTAAVRVRAVFGADDAARLWLNGRAIAQSTRPGGFEPLADRVDLDLAPGDNHLLVKVTNTGGAWRFRLQPLETTVLRGRAAAQEKINQAIDRGCDYLISMQLRDGSWSFDDERFPGGQTALAVYALLKSGVSPKHQAVQRGIAYLRARPTRHTYTAGCTLLALWALRDPAHQEWMADITDELLTWQQGGMWAYPDGEQDLSNTQYAVLGLYAAARSGMKVPLKAWRDVLSQTLRYQGREGGFGYRIGDTGNPTGSMTAAGLSVVAIAKQQISEASRSEPDWSTADRSLEGGARWLAERFTISGSPQVNPATAPDGYRGPYYLYGVERVCTLLGMDRLGGSDWYWEGASWFLDVQGGKGDFPTAWGEGEPNTCFALLFLGRATAAFTGKGVERSDSTYMTDDAKSDVWLRASGDAQLSVWLGGFSPATVERHAWRGKATGLHVSKVEYVIDGEVVGTVNGDAGRVWNADKYPLRHVMTRSGSHAVFARVYLMIEPEVPGGDPTTRVVESLPFDVVVEQVVEAQLLEQTGIGLRNLVRAEETKLTFSSEAGDAPARHAVDGRESSGWTCAPDDKQPSLTLEFERPIKAGEVYLTHLGGRRDGLGEWDRATRVEIRINKLAAAITAELNGDELGMTRIELAKPAPIRSLEIRIVDRVPGKRFVGRVGFNEVGLLAAPGARK